jgi:hypothetical protein
LFASRRWAALDDDTALILGFARICEGLRREVEDIAIKPLELVKKAFVLEESVKLDDAVECV